MKINGVFNGSRVILFYYFILFFSLFSACTSTRIEYCESQIESYNSVSDDYADNVGIIDNRSLCITEYRDENKDSE